MKRTKWYVSLLACIGLLFAGCSEQDMRESFPGVFGKVTLQGFIETNVVSRSAVTDEGVFSWQENDEISVLLSNGTFQTFTLSDGAGTGNGSFTAELEEGMTIGDWAVSPASLNPDLNGSDLVVDLPSAYTWQEGQTNALMAANITDGKLDFKNLGGLVKLLIRNISDGCTIVVTSSTYQLSGQHAVTTTNDGSYIILSKELEGQNNNTLTITSTSSLSNQAFYLPLPVAEGMKLNVKVYEGKVLKLDKNTTLNIKRKQLILMPSLTLPESENAAVNNASSANGVNSALAAAGKEEKNEVVITVNSNTTDGEASPTIEVTEPIVIPESITTAEDASVNITFDEVPVANNQNNTIVLSDNQELTEETTESKSKVNIAIPEISDDMEAPSFDISLPTATVTLSATQETASFGTVKAATADNTLIVDEGVVVNNLIVVAGNVEVRGTVNSIERDEENTKPVKVILGDKGLIENVGENIEIIDYTKEFDGTVNSFEELQDALKYEGGFIRIGQDFTITAPLTINGNFEFKMQFHTLSVSEKLSGSNAVIINKGQLYLSIGDFEGPETSTIKYFIWNEPGSTLGIRGVNIVANGIYAGILAEKATCTIESFNNETHSSIVAPNLAINNGGGTVTMKNGTIEGLVMNQSNGSIIIEAGSVTGNLEFNDANLGNEKGSVTINKGVTLTGLGWDDARIKWN